MGGCFHLCVIFPSKHPVGELPNHGVGTFEDVWILHPSSSIAIDMQSIFSAFFQMGNNQLYTSLFLLAMLDYQ